MIYYSPLMEVLKYVYVIYNVYSTIQFVISKENPCVLEQNPGLNQSTEISFLYDLLAYIPPHQEQLGIPLRYNMAFGVCVCVHVHMCWHLPLQS